MPDLNAYYDAEMRERSVRPLDPERLRRVRWFAATTPASARVLEVGCGAARDGVVLRDAGLHYLGVDLSMEAVRVCRERGLAAVRASATALPLADASVDAAWTMSTLMHLPAEAFTTALAELRRVVRPAGRIVVGVWGHREERLWTSPDGRPFHHRTERTLRAALEAVGAVTELETWAHRPDGERYQLAVVER